MPPTPESSEASNWQIVRRLLSFSWRFRSRCLKVLSVQMVILVLGMSGLGLTGLGIDYLRHVAADGPSPRWPFGWQPATSTSPTQVVLTIAGAIIVLGLLRAMLNYTYNLQIGKLIHVEVVPELRNQVFAKLQKLSFRFFDGNASGSIINRVTGDVQSTRLFIDGVLIQVFIMALSLSVYIFYMVRINAKLTLACLATMPLLWLVTTYFSRLVKPAYRESRRLMDQLILTFSECIQGVQTIKGFALENHTTQRFQKETEGIRQQQQWIFWRVSTFSPLIGFISQVNLVVLLAYGGWLAVHEGLPIGAGLVVFAGLLQQFSGQVSNLAGVADSVQQSLTGARRVFEVLDAPIEIAAPARPALTVNYRARGEVQFDRVSFRFNENNTVLSDVSFQVKPGEVIAIAGPTGAGKSALMSLLPRFYDPNSGSVRIDGVDLREWPVETLRHNIGLVFQENFLFSNTIAKNIAFGHPSASREQIEKAARIARAHEFIMEMPDGYETILRESGVNLSGGQRQRLAIARAILLEPPLLLLDDPTAAIDPETEHEILEAIEKAIAGRTTFIVAHRISTLRRAHRVLVFDEGRLIEEGPHEELIKREGLYQKAVSLQAVDPESMRLLRQGSWQMGGRS